MNFALNGLENAAAFIRNDVIQFITQAAQKKLRWDLVFLDPPGFSNSKKMMRSLDIRRDYRDIIQRCLSLLSPGGTLWFSSNAKAFTLDTAGFPDLIIKDMKEDLVDEDFKGKRIPLCYTLSGG